MERRLSKQFRAVPSVGTWKGSSRTSRVDSCLCNAETATQRRRTSSERPLVLAPGGGSVDRHPELMSTAVCSWIGGRKVVAGWEVADDDRACGNV